MVLQHVIDFTGIVCLVNEALHAMNVMQILTCFLTAAEDVIPNTLWTIPGKGYGNKHSQFVIRFD